MHILKICFKSEYESKCIRNYIKILNIRLNIQTTNYCDISFNKYTASV